MMRRFDWRFLVGLVGLSVVWWWMLVCWTGYRSPRPLDVEPATEATPGDVPKHVGR